MARTTWVRALFFVITLVTGSACAAFDLSITVSPADEDLQGKLERASLLRNLPEDPAPSPQEILAAAQAEYGRLINVLYDDGYFGPVVNVRVDGREAADIAALNAPSAISAIAIRVTPGKTFRFGTATIAPLAPGTTLPEGFTAGAPAELSVIRSTERAATEAWRDLGHAKAEVAKQSISARHRDAVLDVALGVEPGPKLRFGDLILTGESKVRPERIREIAGLPTGEVFSPAALEQSRTRLQRTGTFQAAALFEADEAIGDTLPIEGRITDRLPRTFGFGAEFSSIDGLTLSGFWKHRNLRGGAERLSLAGEIGGLDGTNDGIDLGLEIRYDIPAFRGPDTDFYVLGAIDRLDERHYTANRLIIETGLVNRRASGYVYQFGVGTVAADAEDAFGQRQYWLLTFPATATFDTRDNVLNAKSGNYREYALTPFYAIEGVDSGIRAEADLRWYRTFSDRVTLAFRGHAGSLVGPALSQTPVDFAFYSGGGGSIRGFEYQSIGVELNNGDIAGGRSFVTLSSEVRVQTGDRFSVVGFVDSGFVNGDPLPDTGSVVWNTGVGLGVRYDTGLGPIRFDVATPVSGPDDAKGVEFYIGIGQAF